MSLDKALQASADALVKNSLHKYLQSFEAELETMAMPKSFDPMQRYDARSAAALLGVSVEKLDDLDIENQTDKNSKKAKRYWLRQDLENYILLRREIALTKRGNAAPKPETHIAPEIKDALNL